MDSSGFVAAAAAITTGTVSGSSRIGSSRSGRGVDGDRGQHRAHDGQPDIGQEHHHGQPRTACQNPSSMKKSANTGRAISSRATR